MPRNRQKNAYFTVGIPLESELYRDLQTDAQETGVSIPQLLVVRLADWYKFSTSACLQTFTPPATTRMTQQQIYAPLSDLQVRASAAVTAWGGSEDV